MGKLAGLSESRVAMGWLSIRPGHRRVDRLKDGGASADQQRDEASGMVSEASLRQWLLGLHMALRDWAASLR
jgi:hypothetical protein